MKMTQMEKRQLMIFVLVAYGLTYVLGLAMWAFYGTGADLSVFPNAQMMYPAAGVMLAYLITKKEDKKLPRALFVYSSNGCVRFTVCIHAQNHEVWRDRGICLADGRPGAYYSGKYYFLDLFSGCRKRKKSCLWIKRKKLEIIFSLYSPVLCTVYCENGNCQRSRRTTERFWKNMD